MGALASTGCYPFDQQRQGMVLGEGGAVLVLELASLAAQRGASIYGELLGFGLTADAHHVSAPDLDQRAALTAITQALHRACITPAQVGYLHAHGTATDRNDRHEASLIQTLFPKALPISSTKGATGHTIGASGALGAVICLLAMRHQQLPPCTGLSSPAFDLNVVRHAQTANIRYSLCLSFGFGGQNAAIVLAK
jgi:3-oxoacyl-[acyl-carrier-protein] synthase II